MTQTAPSPDKSASPAGSPQLVPPDERFWQRYSPHAEFPLSGAGSLAIHLLIFGVLGLIAWLGILLFSHSSRSLPVEAVRLAPGGGGNPHGTGDGANTGAAPQEAGGQNSEGTSEEAPPENVERPRLNVKPGPNVKSQFNEDAIRYLQQTDTENAQVFQRLSDAGKAIRLPDRKPSGRGKGGTGSGGGNGGGEGTGTGDGKGAGQGTLTKREKRMIRWVMGFNPSNAQDYVGQLQGLGAILAVPMRPSADVNNPDDYRLIRDLSSRPPELTKENLANLNRIFWYDNNRDSATAVMNLLGLRLQPSHFIAFMPQELEDKLYRLEKEYLDKHYPGRTEDDITATKFQIRNEGGRYEPVMSSLKVKPRR